jgi:CRP-like cAMP-binding protein
MHTPARSSLALRRVLLLVGLSDERLDTLAQQCHWRSAPARELVVSRQADDMDVFFLVSGRVRVTTYAASGREVTFRDVAEGDCFGDVAAIDGQPRSADVVTLEPSVLASLNRDAFLQLLAEEPAVARREMERLAGLVRKLSQRVIDLSTLPVQHRLHAELLRLAREAGVESNRARLEPAPRHADLASRISTYREQVTRELSALARQGVLVKDGKALVIADVERLAQLVARAGGD